MEFKPHSDKQDRVIFSESRITLAGTGIQWGKTMCGAVRMKMRMHEFTAPDDNFLICSPTYKVLKQSSLPPFLRIMDGYGEYNKSDAVFEMYNGGKCWMRTGTDPDSIVGITNIRHIWGDEAGLFSLYFWENIQARSSLKQAQIDLTTSPYTINWIYKELIRPHERGEMPPEELLYVRARSDENPYFPRDEVEKKRKTMDDRRFRMIYGGEFGKMEGLVYDIFDHDENVCSWPEGKNPNERFFAGIDWGYTEPFALKVVGALGGDFKVYSEVKKARKTLSDIIDICRQKQTIFGIEHFFCDPSQPAYIEELNRAGLPASPAVNDIKHGVAKVYELFKTRRLKLIAGQTPHLIDEIETYHYPDPKDLPPDKDAKDANPVGQNDHCLDALRYVMVSIHDYHERRAPFVPGEKPVGNNVDRINRLLRKR